MARLTEKQQILLVVSVSTLLSGLAGGGVWWTKGAIEEQIAATKTLNEQVVAAEQKIGEIPGLERGVIILRENLQEYVKILPAEKEENEFVRATNTFFIQAGVQMDKFMPVTRGTPGKKTAFDQYTYQFEFRATIWQFMKVVSFFENYERFVKITSFSLQSGDTVQTQARGPLQPGQDMLHKITMSVETYIYTGAKSHKDVEIPNYTNRVALLKPEIIAARESLSTERYEFKGPRGRRDIFMDPRATNVPGTDRARVPEEAQRQKIEECRRDIAEITGLIRRRDDPQTTVIERYQLTGLIREKISALKQKVEEVNDKGLIVHVALKVTWNKDVEEPLAALESRPAETAERGLSLKDMQMVLAIMKEHLQAGRLEEARQQYEAHANDIRVPSGDPREAIARDIEAVHLLTKAAIEFGAMKLDISGVVVNEGGKSGLILNGVVYQEGDYIEDNLLVKQVSSEYVDFVYKGYSVRKSW
jgi:hypothetical protein